MHVEVESCLLSGQIFYSARDGTWEANGSSNHGVEQMIIELHIYKKENWFLCVYYKPPRVKDHEFEKVFVETCNLLQTESNHLLLYYFFDIYYWRYEF